MAKKSTDVIVSKRTEMYWQAVKDVIDAAGEYAYATKLKDNLLDEDTRFKVQGVFEDSPVYQGDMDKLERAILDKEKKYCDKVAWLNLLCGQYGLMKVTKPEKLLKGYLLDKNLRRSFKSKAKRWRKKNEIRCLQEFVGYKPKK